MLPLISALTILSVGATPTCDAPTRAKFSQLTGLFSATAQVRDAISAKKSLGEVVPLARRALAAGQRAQPKVQELACGLDDTHAFDACVAPVIWSCESVPMAIDWEAMKGLSRTADEEKAWTLMSQGGVDLLTPAPSFAGGCGDNGCAPQSVAVPNALVTGDGLDAWLSLARGDSALAGAAQQALHSLADTISGASCVDAGQGATKAQLQSAADKLDKFRVGLAPSQAATVGAPVDALAKAIRKGVPKKKCAIPGE